MWNCSFHNAGLPTRIASDKLSAKFAEEKYAVYYRNLSSIVTKTLSDAPEGKSQRGNSLSGPGSTAEETVGVRTVLPHLLALLGIRSILDVPCGDFNYMRDILNAPATPASISYRGMDIVTTLVQQLEATFGTRASNSTTRHTRRHRISFGRFDLAEEYLWPADLVILRDILFHFDAARAQGVLRRVALSGCRFVLVTYFPSVDNERAARKYRAGHGFKSYASWNLEGAPFAMPPPLLSIGQDGNRPDRVVGLWECASLQFSTP